MPIQDPPSGVLARLSDDLAAAVKRAGASVLAVHGRPRFPASGLAWRDQLVITASHVLERDTDLHITTPDGAEQAVQLVGRDRGTDVAVLQAQAPEPFQFAEPAAPGNLVLAVGRPGTPEAIASFGAVSSVGGAWRTAQGGVLDAYVRADVALLPGLSGGALVDVGGRLVGMLSAQLAGGDPVAIPAASLDAIVQRIRGGGSLKRAYLGVSTQAVELQELLRRKLSIQQATGLMLVGLEPGAPAERAGLLAGDIVLAIGERVVEDGEALQMALGPAAIGSSTRIKFIRGGQLRELDVVPAPRPD
jgi:S1-C subfamily serine protease